MNRPELLLVIYCALIVAASMTGGRLSSLMRMTHLRAQMLMSAVGGLMLGIGMLHLLPHATELLGSSAKSGSAALVGLISMFLLIRLFHTHDHEMVHDSTAEATACQHDCTGPEHAHEHAHSHEHATSRDHAHHHHGHTHHEPNAKRIGWIGMFFGLAMHTLIDGVALGSSVMADARHEVWLGLAGIGTFLAIALHKPLDAFAISSVMRRQGWGIVARNLVNLFFSLACPIGAAMVVFGARWWSAEELALGWGLSISAGFFICIALADLLPEVAFHNHDRGKLTAALIAGVLLAVAIENLPGHEHGHHGHGETAVEEEHAGHDHAGHTH